MPDNASAPAPSAAPVSGVIRAFRNPTAVKLRCGVYAQVCSIGHEEPSPLHGGNAGGELWWTTGGFFCPNQAPHAFDIAAVQHEIGGPFVPIYPYRLQKEVAP